jgi:hypothetical protein
MIVFYRLFNGYYVAVEVFVNIVYHGSEGGRFATSGWSCNQEQPSRPAAQSLANLRQTYFIKGQNFRRDKTQNQRKVALLAKYRNTKSALIAKCKTKVCAAFFLKLLLVPVGCNTSHQSRSIIRLENFGFQGPERTVYS